MHGGSSESQSISPTWHVQNISYCPVKLSLLSPPLQSAQEWEDSIVLARTCEPFHPPHSHKLVQGSVTNSICMDNGVQLPQTIPLQGKLAPSQQGCTLFDCWGTSAKEIPLSHTFQETTAMGVVAGGVFVCLFSNHIPIRQIKKKISDLLFPHEQFLTLPWLHPKLHLLRVRAFHLQQGECIHI